jgi:chemotaxis protein histidine kinase CheA
MIGGPEEEILMLKRNYLQTLQLKLERVELLMGQWGRQATAASLDEAIGILHKIHGTAGTYELDDISRMAADCEEVLRVGAREGKAGREKFLADMLARLSEIRQALVTAR